jgi:peroxiredoxin
MMPALPFLRPAVAAAFLLLAVHGTAQKLPSVSLKDLDGKSVDTGKLAANGPVLVAFWATWCGPCKQELNAYHELYEKWQRETGVRIVAVSIDDARSMRRVAPYVNSVMWDFQVLLDPNKDFARAMQVNNVPHTFLIDKTGKIVWQHNNYAPGDEKEVRAQLRKLTGK